MHVALPRSNTPSPHLAAGEDPIVCNAHREWGSHFQLLHPRLPPLEAKPSGNTSDGGRGPTYHLDLSPDRPLVVGYVSPDFFTHSVSYFAEAPLTKHR